MERRDDLIKKFVVNPHYYTTTLQKPIEQEEYDRPKFIKVGEKYYIDGAGNHRVALCKLLGVDYIMAHVTEEVLNPRKKALIDKYNRC